MDFSPYGFEPNEHKKKDVLKEAKDLSLAPYDRWKWLIKKMYSEIGQITLFNN